MCHIVPAGSFKYTPLKQVRRNEAFISKKKITEIGDNFVHFRQVEKREKRDLIDRDEGLYND